MAEIPRKDRAAIKSDIALSRERMGRELSGLRYEFDFPRKLKSSFRRRPAIWSIALASIGVLLVVTPARKKKVYIRPELSKKGKGENVVKAGFALGALKLATDLLRPLLIKFVTNKVSSYASARVRKERGF